MRVPASRWPVPSPPSVDGTIDAPGGTINISTTPLNAIPFPSDRAGGVAGIAGGLNAAGVSLINPLAAACTGQQHRPGSGYALYAAHRCGAGRRQRQPDLRPRLCRHSAGQPDRCIGQLRCLRPACRQWRAQRCRNRLRAHAGMERCRLDRAGRSAGLYADGSLLAQGGSSRPKAAACRLPACSRPTIPYVPSSTAIVLQQSGLLVPGSGLQPDGIAAPATATGVLYFALDRLDGSGITSLILGPNASGASSINNAITRVCRSALPAISISRWARALSVCVDSYRVAGGQQGPVERQHHCLQRRAMARYRSAAPYVEVTGLLGSTEAASTARWRVDGTLDIVADFMDLGGQINLQGWANTNLTASNAIRFYEPTATLNTLQRQVYSRSVVQHRQHHLAGGRALPGHQLRLRNRRQPFGPDQRARARRSAPRLPSWATAPPAHAAVGGRQPVAGCKQHRAERHGLGAFRRSHHRCTEPQCHADRLRP
jgi:hypothetical protein